MKRSRFGAGLLVLLLLAGLVADRSISRCHEPVSQALTQAGSSLLEEDWESAARLTSRATEDWRRFQPLRAAMGNQTATEEIDSLFARLAVYLSTWDPQSASLCAELARRISQLYPQLTWWALL